MDLVIAQRILVSIGIALFWHLINDERTLQCLPYLLASFAVDFCW
jgi:hypothetical protein